MTFSTRRIVANASWYFAIGVIMLIVLIPLWVSIVAAFQPNSYIPSNAIHFWPKQWSFGNIIDAWKQGGLGRGYLVTIMLTVLNIIPNLFFSTLLGYVFAKKRFWGKNTIFILLLASMMIPGEITMIPNFILYRYLGWINTIGPLVFPGGIINVFGIFLMRQFIQDIPDELLDASKIDGCGSFRSYWNVILPLCKPAIATLSILTFSGLWNDYMGPLIYLNNASLYTVQLHVADMVTQFSGTSFEGTLQQTADIIAAAPIVIVFLCLQRYFIRGISLTGLK
ncbi:carbohydrate ABC transporter permease [Alicyclobacillus fodiniaquatilis]|jgi:multiple sugar transport system permease protein|uniref:Carbohydrate ABC transporter permease n=1 Tax=Alicyclobacillus fodiniaquatilis TaxID=1661150 RepID=A0ABW4JGZ5_9BACL